MPGLQSSVSPSALPLARFFWMSACVTGPTRWPPIDMYHGSWFAIGLSSPGRSDARGGFVLDGLGARGVEPEQVRQLDQEDALGAVDVRVGAHDRVAEHVERLLLRGGRDAGDDLGQRHRPPQLALD